MNSANINLKQLNGIIYGAGPGSFTGLRVGLSVAKAFAYALNIPLYPVNGLATIAHQAFKELNHNEKNKAQVLSMIDARMHQVYWGIFNENSYHNELHVDFPKDITIENEGPIVLAGVQYQPYIELLPKEVNKK